VPRRLGLRFAVEAAFILGVAAAALIVDRTGAIDLTWPQILAVMFVAWLLTAAFEWAASRRAATQPGSLEGEPAEADPLGAPPPPETVVPPVVAGLPLPLPSSEPEAASAGEAPDRLAEEPEPEPEPEPEDEPQAEPEQEPEDAPQAEDAPAEPEDVGAADEPEAAPEPAPPIPLPERKPEPAPQPAPAIEPELEPAAAAPLVHTAPREWNLWDLERLVNENAGKDVVRAEEWGYLLVYLREFASADGVLPTDFDGLVRDSFGDLIAGARQA
jgi:hypothetical protein